MTPQEKRFIYGYKAANTVISGKRLYTIDEIQQMMLQISLDASVLNTKSSAFSALDKRLIHLQQIFHDETTDKRSGDDSWGYITPR